MGFLLDTSSTILCSHGGQAHVTVPNPRVTIAGNPTVLAATPWTISGCPLPRPCVTATFLTGTTRVTSLGRPLALSTGDGICAPNETPLLPEAVQQRVVAL